jgi:hypothetical protein
VRWAFWPPGTEPSKFSETGDGIWIRHDDDDGVANYESEGEEEMEEEDGGSESGEEASGEEGFLDGEEEAEEAEESNDARIGGRFGALALEDAVTESTEEEWKIDVQ